MISRIGFHRSHDVKEVIHIKVKKCSGYFNPECKSFAVDPHVTTFSDLKKILIGAFNLTEAFHISYLCRDDNGESVYLALLTEWDLDAAFLTASDPYLRLKVDEAPCNKTTNYTEDATEDDNESNSPQSGSPVRIAQVPQAWMSYVGKAFSKITSGISSNFSLEQNEDTDSFFPSMPPLGDREFHEFLDKTGRLVRPDDLRLRIYHGGIEPSLRKVVWRLLLNIFPQHLTGVERINYMKGKAKEYHRLCTQWKSRMKESFVKELSRMIWQDVLRTDRNHSYFSGPDSSPHMTALHNLLLTYALTHKNTRYCQGMSDIASPILMVMDNESHAYVCFCGAMIRLQDNFSNTGDVMTKKFEHLALLLRYHDQEYFDFLKSVGAENMFFCYRWLLLEMKREFTFEDALIVLEVMWSSLPPQPPENDLDLGTIDLEVRRESIVTQCLKKTDSLPHLSLNAKNLTTSLHNVRSLPNIEVPISSRHAKSSKIQNSTVSYRCKDLYPDQAHDILQSRPWVLGGDGIDNNSSKFQNSSTNTKKNEGYISLDDFTFSSQTIHRNLTIDALDLPPPEELGYGNPFLLFMCVTVLLDHKEELMSSQRDYDDVVMHFDSLVRKHSPSKIISKAMRLFASYLRSQSTTPKIDT